jgi:hypothetical protein
VSKIATSAVCGMFERSYTEERGSSFNHNQFTQPHSIITRAPPMPYTHHAEGLVDPKVGYKKP